MKFGKEFVAQMVPEWQEAYMNYDHLKKLLKEIHVKTQADKPPASALTRQISRYRAFSGLLIHRHEVRPVHDRHHEISHVEVNHNNNNNTIINNSNSSSSNSNNNNHHHHDIESQAILVHMNRTGSENFRYHTTCLTPEEHEIEFFRSLDDEFNKVEKFYRSKVNEVILEAQELNKQMDALIAFRIKVENPNVFFDPEVEMGRLASDVAASAAALAASTPHLAKASASKRVHHRRMESIDEAASVHGKPGGLMSDDTENRLGSERSDGDVPVIRTPPMEILSNVKLQDHLESPLTTLKSFLKVPMNTELSFTTENLKRVEDNLKIAFAEFYRKLCLLKKYSFLNIEAFSKIMKKYDKITSRDARKSYMKMVDKSYLGSSEDVIKIMERVEATFIKHFSNSNWSKGMGVLRPKTKREKHRITFTMGMFAGCAIALLFALILLVRVRNIMNQPGASQYMETMFPLYSLFGFIVLHMLMYAGNIFFWRKYRVNYSFIFGFKPGTELGYREVLMLSFGLAVAALACVLGNLDMQMDPRTKDYKAFTELLPLLLVIVVILVMLCPFNIIYRSSRFFFLRTLFRALFAPFFKITLPDFILADQLCSQVQALRSLEFYICYYGWGDYRHRKNTCRSHNSFNVFYFIVAGLPFWLRFCQCMRRLIEEKDGLQAWNASKYFLAIVAVCARTAYGLNKDSVAWKVVAWLLLIGVGIFVAYWDLVYDWGVLNRKSKNRWLRDKLLVPYKSIYYVAIVVNVVLRLAWVETVLDLNKFALHSQAYTAIVASLEIFRRGVWNFFRLEYEHLTNISKFRAFKSVPLPFNYDVDDKDESV